MTEATAIPRPFIPVQMVTPRAAGNQRIKPILDEHGVPVWQAGDTDIRTSPVTSLGWCQGTVSSRSDNGNIKGTLYVTGSRVIVVAERYAHGSRYHSYGVGGGTVLAAAASKVSQVRAERATAGSFQVAQVRLPWITSMVWGLPTSKKGLRGELRICAQHLSAFGEPEAVLLLIRLAHAQDMFAVLDGLIARIRTDRRDFKQTSAEARARLDALPDPRTVQATNDRLPSIQLPGGYRVSAETAARGVVSCRSYAIS